MAGVGPGDTMLDVGCGDGLIGLAALEHGADVIFSDVSEACLDDCRAVAGDRARYHLAGATDLGDVAADCDGPGDAMSGFDEYDLFAAAEQAGFRTITLETVVELKPEPMVPTRDWDVLLASSPNPLAPTLGEAMRAALDDDEAARLEAKLRPQVEQGLGRTRFARAFLTATKGA